MSLSQTKSYTINKKNNKNQKQSKHNKQIYHQIYIKEPNKTEINIDNTQLNQDQKEIQLKINNKTIVFASNFNSGNMKSVSHIDNLHFDIELHSDCEDNLKTTKKNRSWFFFSVTTFFNQNSTLSFSIKNITNQYKNYLDGYKPVYYICRNQNDHDQLPDGFLNEKDLNWERLEEEIILRKVEDENELKEREKPFRGLCDVSFKFQFKEDVYSVYFAFCYPYSYNKIINSCEKLVNDIHIRQPAFDYKSKEYKIFNKFKHSSGNYNENLCNREFNKILHSPWLKNQIYCHKETLTYSTQRRKIELITISSFDQITSNKEYQLKGLFGNNTNNINRCYSFSQEKQIIFISSRVHPAETTSSYLLEGLLNFLTDESDLRSRLLRRYFVFKIIPVINPDGVSNGYYRFDCNGFNLNRHYVNPDSQLNPEVYAIKRLFTYYSQQYRVKHFFDLHGHFSSKGQFVFMNNMDFVNQVETLTIPFLLSCLNEDFLFKSCVYGEKSMKSKEYGDKYTKEGSSRVYFYRSCGVTSSYTVEVSGYRSQNMSGQSGRSRENKNYIPFSDFEYNDEVLCLLEIEDEKRNEIKNHELRFDLNGNYVYQNIIKKDMKDFFTIQCYFRLGCDLLTSILEYEEINPYIIKKKKIPDEYLILLNNNEEYQNKKLSDKLFQTSNRNIRRIICNKLLLDDDKFKSNVLNKTYANCIEDVRKKNSIWDKFMNKHKNDKNKPYNERSGRLSSSLKSGFDLNFIEDFRKEKEKTVKEYKTEKNLVKINSERLERGENLKSDSVRLIQNLKLPKI